MAKSGVGWSHAGGWVLPFLLRFTSRQFSFSWLAALAQGRRGLVKKYNEEDEREAEVRGLSMVLQSPLALLCGHSPSPCLCVDHLPQVPGEMGLPEQKAAELERTLGLTVQMEKLRLREGTKFSLSFLQKANSLSQVWPLGRAGSGHHQGQRSHAFRKPSPPKGRKEKKRSRGRSEISGNPLGGEVGRGEVYVRFPGEGGRVEQEEPGFRQVEPTSPPRLSFSIWKMGICFSSLASC